MYIGYRTFLFSGNMKCKKKTAVILGLGMQGKAALYDLIHNTDVSKIIAADSRPDLNDCLNGYPSGRVTAQKIDARNEKDLISVMRDVDVVIEALPGEFAFTAGKLAAELGVNLVSSMYFLNPMEQNEEKIKLLKEEIHRLDIKAKEKGITILPEFGLDPGIDLVLGKKALGELDEIEEFYSYGAGLPELKAADNELKYKFSWSAIGVMRAYRRPVWIISQGKVRKIEAPHIFEPENMHVLRAEGLKSSVECYPNGNSMKYAEQFGIQDSIKEMARYTCRWEGHCSFWNVMTKSGFLNENPVSVGGTSIIPMEFTTALLDSQDQFHFRENERDVTFIRVEVRGKKNGKERRIVYQLTDRRDMETGFTSMQRTVGFTMSLGARLILDGKLKKNGLLTPMDVPFELVTAGLEKHDISIVRNEYPWY